MVFELADSWVWDFWTADDGVDHHLFFLRASRAIRNPERRHHRATVGHAVSADLVNWRLVVDAVLPADEPRFDDLAIWTGSVVHADDHSWRMFYTGSSRAERGLIQRIGVARSDDLYTWESADEPIVEADSRWYERLGESSWPDQAWRDPWVLRDPGGDGWHMLITARASHGPVDQRGVIGHARSADLASWEVSQPLTEPGAGFGQLEVPQSVEIDGRHYLVFSCLPAELAADRRASALPTGVWAARGASPLGPWDIEGAAPLTDPTLYSGKVVRDRFDRWRFLAFQHTMADGRFIGRIVESAELPDALTR